MKKHEQRVCVLRTHTADVMHTCLHTDSESPEASDGFSQSENRYDQRKSSENIINAII